MARLRPPPAARARVSGGASERRASPVQAGREGEARRWGERQAAGGGRRALSTLEGTPLSSLPRMYTCAQRARARRARVTPRPAAVRARAGAARGAHLGPPSTAHSARGTARGAGRRARGAGRGARGAGRGARGAGRGARGAGRGGAGRGARGAGRGARGAGRGARGRGADRALGVLKGLEGLAAHLHSDLARPARARGRRRAAGAAGRRGGGLVRGVGRGVSDWYGV